MPDADKLIRIGSNSSYVFLKYKDTGLGENNVPPLLVVPLSQIAYISENQNGNGQDDGLGMTDFEKEILKHVKRIDGKMKPQPLIERHEHEDYVTEKLLRPYIVKEMKCSESEVQISGFIRFGRDEPDPKSASSYFNNDPSDRRTIQKFAAEWRKTAKKWKVFGFASLDGAENMNRDLSKKRATAAQVELCSVLGLKSKPDCDEKITTAKGGEDHPINGVANSRSAIVAVCTKQEAELSPEHSVSRYVPQPLPGHFQSVIPVLSGTPAYRSSLTRATVSPTMPAAIIHN